MINIKNLNEPLDINLVGGKAASLSSMMSAGINVPAGFVLEKSSYSSFLEDDNFLNNSKSILERHLKKLKSKYVMVRSSAIGEDSIDTSFAGQLDSYQSNNSIDDVIDNILKCWNSLKNQRVKHYEQQQGKVLSEMAVIVQEMIEPEYAGVLFTTSPITQEGVYGEYIEGHAERLVQGEVTPESFEVITRDELNEDLPFDVKQLLEQSDLVLKKYQGVPQDIEWAYKNKTFYFVQSRPITTLKDKIKWSNTNVNENYPDKLSPLLYSIAKQSYYHYYKNLALNLNVIDKYDDRSEQYFSNAIGIFGHRMYYNMSSIHNIIQLSPLADLLQKSFDDFVGYQKKNNLNQKFNNLLSKIKIAIKMIYHLMNLSEKVKIMEEKISDYASTNTDDMSYADLTKSFHTFLFIRFHLWINASFADFYAMLTHGFLGKCLNSLKLENHQGIQNGLIQAIPNLISNQPLHRLWEINLKIDEKDNYKELFLKNSGEIYQLLQTDDKYLAVKDLVDNYLKDWGFRCPGELTFLTDNYIENPTAFIDMIKTYRSTSPENPQRLLDLKHADQVNLQYETKLKIRRAYKLKPLKKWFSTFALRVLVRLTMFSISSRERVRLKQAQMYYTFKNACKKLGVFFKEKQIVKDPNDIFYLEYKEINRILSGEETDIQYIQSLINLRKESINEADEVPDNIYTFREDFGLNYFDQDTSAESKDGTYRGLAACSGKIKGKITIVETLSEINKLKKGDILVTKQTDPGWICVFPMISGLIVEKGGVLSHSAIVAREFGVPAVVGIPHITEYLKDGQEVIINGDTGVIECLD